MTQSTDIKALFWNLVRPERNNLLKFLAVVALLGIVVYSTLSAQVPGVIGLLADDGAYALYAKALRLGVGYVDLTNGGELAARRYPIGFPWILSRVLQTNVSPFENAERAQWLAVAFCAMYVLLSFMYLRLVGRLSDWTSLLAAGCLALNPQSVVFGCLVISDVPFACASIAALLLVHVAQSKNDNASYLWALVGFVIGSACLIRYFGVFLIVAVGLPMLAQRQWRRLFQFGASVFCILAPWFVYRHFAGGDTYTREILAQFVTHSDGVGTEFVSATYQTLFWQQSQFASVAVMIVNLPVTVLTRSVIVFCILFGTYYALNKRECDVWRPSIYFLALSLVTTIAMESIYTIYGGALAARYLIPVGPVVLLLAAHGAKKVWTHCRLSPQHGVLGAQLYLAITIGCHVYHNAHSVWFSAEKRSSIQSEYNHLFHYIAKEVPQNAKLVATFAECVTFYTGRPCAVWPTNSTNPLSPRQVAHFLKRSKAQYLIYLANEKESTRKDVEIFNYLARFEPGLLAVQYVTPKKGLAILKIRQMKE